MTTNVRLQNLRDFTVQIRNANDQIVGTGIAVSTDGKIVTCAHVVQAAGIDPRNSNGAEVGVYFPQARGGEEKNRRATVVKHFKDYDDDIVLLQLTDSPSPLAPEQIPILGTASSSDEHLFRSYGYRRMEKYIAGWADGKIQGSVEAPEGFNIQCEPVQLESSQINSGMSGSAVLDTTRNLVIGIVSETWFPDLSTKDRDTAWAVDGRVLSLEPLGLTLQDMPLPLKAAPEPKTDEQTKQQVVQVAQVTAEQRTVEERFSWNNAPAVLTEWTGRDHLIAQITDDWNDPNKHVTGLIGFGGEGKSSLARKWVDAIISHPPVGERPGVGSPDGVFWWGFYENRSVDEFLEAALKYMSGGRIDSRQVQSSSLRAQIIGSMLGAESYLFVLDGLEVMQHQEGDQYGLLQSNDLRDLLTFFARPDNQSFCLITSRAPLLDLMEYTTYTHRDVERLSEDDGHALLRRLGVKGSDAELNKVVTDWDRHALTLSILAAYLAERFEGDIRHLADIPVPTTDEPRYERVHRVLRRYDEHLTIDEREFLKLFSVFRLPVHESAFEKVFILLLPSFGNLGTKPKQNFLTRLFGSKTSSGLQSTNPQFTNLLNRLVTYRLIRHDEREKTYTAHPLIRNHYFAFFTKGPSTGSGQALPQVQAAHSQIKDYYLSIAGDTPQYPTLDDLKPLIEVVHHACQSGAFEEAHKIRRERIYQGDSRVLVHQIGAWETAYALMLEFFLNKDTSQDPQTSETNTKLWTLNEIGLCLMNLGRLRDAVPFYERVVKSAVNEQNWQHASNVYLNLAELHALLGALEASAEATRQALDLARKAEDKKYECYSLVWRAWTGHLCGELTNASLTFQKAEVMERERLSSINIRFLCSTRGIQHADHLRHIGDADYARRVAEDNLIISEEEHWPYIVSPCHRVLGDLDSDTGDHDSARAHYESALKIARGISNRQVLIEALLARGRFYAKRISEVFKTSEVSQALNDLNEALGYCVESGYRIHEADVRVALAWAYLASGEKEKAKQSAERALQMSNEMGYHWGKVDAEEVLDGIARSDPESKPTRRASQNKTEAASKSKGKRRSNLK